MDLKESLAIDKYLTEVYPDKPLPLKQAVLFVETLQANLQTKDAKTAINTMVKLIPHLKPSAEFNRLFNDYKFLDSLVNYAVANPLENAPYMVLNSYLKGDFLEESTLKNPYNNGGFKNFFLVFGANIKILENIPKRILTQLPALASVSTSFVIWVIAASTNPVNKNIALKIFIMLRKMEFTQLFENICKNKLISPELMILVSTYHLKNVIKIIHSLSNSKFDKNSNYLHQGILVKICEGIKKIAPEQLIAGLPDDKAFEVLGFTRDPINYLVSKYNIAIALTCLQFMNGAENKGLIAYSAKQHTFCKDPKKYFPLHRFIFEVAYLINRHLFQKSNPNFEHLSKFILSGDSLTSGLINKTFNYWDASNGSGEDDIKTIVDLIKLDLSYINSLVMNVKDFLVVKEKSMALLYQEIKRIQLGFFRNNQFSQYLDSNDMKRFNNDIMENLKFFIANERLSELSHGTVCYLEDPSYLSARTKAEKRVKMMLSTNRNTILYKQIDPHVDAENVEMTTMNSKSLSVSRIKKVITEDSTIGNGTKSLISTKSFRISRQDILVDGRHKIVKLTVLFKNDEPPFIFYTDNQHNAILWIDSLNLLINKFNFNKISSETKNHMEQLFDIKRTMQFSPLDEVFNNANIDQYKGKTGNFLQIENIKFDDSNNMVATKFLDLLKATSVNNDAIAEEKEEEVEPAEKSPFENFEYNYKDLLAVSEGFYYN